MKPNYKASAAKYRGLYYDSQEQVSGLFKSRQYAWERIAELTKEIEELKRKYSEALNKLIALQEKIVKQEVEE